jgi:hypothetical protein
LIDTLRFLVLMSLLTVLLLMVVQKVVVEVELEFFFV